MDPCSLDKIALWHQLCVCMYMDQQSEGPNVLKCSNHVSACYGHKSHMQIAYPLLYARLTAQRYDRIKFCKACRTPSEIASLACLYGL